MGESNSKNAALSEEISIHIETMKQIQKDLSELPPESTDPEATSKVTFIDFLNCRLNPNFHL
jgi:hypothetical protein